ncbi:MAG: CoA transferase subunit A [Spirochaetales bacterium]|jgi:glutaconate CoA-transferase, subunit A|nr:CoA transferase subunit A [Spirochaetales bacterium]
MSTSLKTGSGPLFVKPDADAGRERSRRKDKRLKNKTTTVKEAVIRFIHDGDYLALGGFGSNRIAASLLHEIVRQRRKNLGLAGHTVTHDCQILAAGRCFNRCDVAYVVGLEARGLSKNARNMFEDGSVEVAEWTNASLAWRFKAAAMGLPFLPARVMMGTDTFEHSGAKEILCPFTGTKLLALPALSPDVALIHVHRADVHGNCQIDGIIMADDDIAKASKRVIITTEKIISVEEIRREPNRTVIPYWCVDAVIEMPFGSYPANMPGEYFSDEDHLKEWLVAEKDPESFKAFLEKNIFGCSDFYEYLQKNGGIEKIKLLRDKEFLSNSKGGVIDG